MVPASCQDALTRYRVSELLRYFNDEVEEGAVDFGELMRGAGGDGDHVAFDQVVHGATGDGGAPDFTGSRFFAFHDGATGDEGGFTRLDVKNVGVVMMDFRRACRDAASGENLIAVVGGQDLSEGEGVVDLGVIKYDNFCGSRFGEGGGGGEAEGEQGYERGEFHNFGDGGCQPKAGWNGAAEHAIAPPCGEGENRGRVLNNFQDDGLPDCTLRADL